MAHGLGDGPLVLAHIAEQLAAEGFVVGAPMFTDSSDSDCECVASMGASKLLEQNDLRVAAMEAISVLISNSADDVLPMLAQLLPAFIQRFEATFAMQDFDAGDQLKKEQTQGLLCAVFQALYRKLDKPTVAPHTDTVMQQLLRVLQAKNANCHEECFSAISAVSDVLEADFMVSNSPQKWLGTKESELILHFARNTWQLCSHS